MKLTILAAVLFAVARVWVGFNFEPEAFQWLNLYKTSAHLFIASLGTCWWFQRRRWQLWLFIALNVVEVAVATLTRL